jgi:hypothetical protein
MSFSAVVAGNFQFFPFFGDGGSAARFALLSAPFFLMKNSSTEKEKIGRFFFFLQWGNTMYINSCY